MLEPSQNKTAKTDDHKRVLVSRWRIRWLGSWSQIKLPSVWEGVALISSWRMRKEQRRWRPGLKAGDLRMSQQVMNGWLPKWTVLLTALDIIRPLRSRWRFESWSQLAAHWQRTCVSVNRHFIYSFPFFPPTQKVPLGWRNKFLIISGTWLMCSLLFSKLLETIPQEENIKGFFQSSSQLILSNEFFRNSSWNTHWMLFLCVCACQCNKFMYFRTISLTLV